jgi:hypothetical protein
MHFEDGDVGSVEFAVFDCCACMGLFCLRLCVCPNLSVPAVIMRKNVQRNFRACSNMS